VKNYGKGISEDIKKYFAASVAEKLISSLGSEGKDNGMIDSDD